MVVGLGVSSGLALYQSNQMQAKMDKNKDIQNTLKSALKSYYSKNGRYPCPADPRAAIDGTGMGVEVASCSGSGISSAIGRGGEQVAIGAVPTRTLNIDDKLSFDAWGSKITYAVTRDYTSAPVPTDGGAISIVDGSGSHLTSTPGNAIYALILPGNDKRGFFSKNGGASPNQVCNTAVPAGENCDNDAVFYSSIFTNQTENDQIFTAAVDYTSANPTPYSPPPTTPPPPTVVPPPPPPPVVRPPVRRPVGGGGGGGGGSSGGGFGFQGSRPGDVYATREEALRAGGTGKQVNQNPNTYNTRSGFGNMGTNGGGGGGGGGSSRVICTHFYKQGKIDRAVWLADLRFTADHLSATTIRGYHLWAIPYVQLMRKSKFAEALMWPLAIHRAEELAYQMGVLEKPNYIGKAIRFILEPICFTIGLFAKAKDYKVLYTAKEIKEIEG